MNNVLRFPAPHQAAQHIPRQQAQTNPMRMIMDRFMHGVQPEQILDQMAGPEAKQARKIIHGKNPAQLRSIAMNMAQQRGVKIEDLAAELGIRLPE